MGLACLPRPTSAARLLLALLAVASSTAHASDSAGQEFIVTYLPNLAAGVPTIEVQLTASTATTVTVEHPVLSPTFVTSVGVTPGATTTVVIPSAASIGWTADAVANNAVRLSAAADFSAHLINRKGATSDGALGIPVEALGLEYYAADYDPPPSNPGGQLCVVATVDGTTVTITPSVPLIGGHPAGVPFDVALDRGEAYFGQTTAGASVGLSGTHVVADQPVCLSNGAYCLNVPPPTTACDHIFEVATPVVSWRQSYLAANVPDRPDGSIYRVFASTDLTDVTLDGAPIVGSPIDAGEYLEVGPLPGNHVFGASAPILVTQYVPGGASAGATMGDPAMCNLVATDQFTTDRRFSTFLGGSWPSPAFAEHYLLVFAADSDAATITLNAVPIGAGSFASIPGTGHSVATLTVPAGTYRTESTAGHGVLVVGHSTGPQSYAYPGGTALECAATVPLCSPDGLDAGPCCTPAQPSTPLPSVFTHDALSVCWDDCGVESQTRCVAQWKPWALNLSPCAVRIMRLELGDAGGLPKWRGRIRLQYARTWREEGPGGTSLQVWRYLANGDLKRTSFAGAEPCPVPPCASAHGGRVHFTGYLDMVRPCGGGTRQFAWMLTHPCDEFVHQPGFPRAGTFHPDRSYTFLGPAAGFAPTPLQPAESGTLATADMRRVDLSFGPPMCLHKEPAQASIDPIVEGCRCGAPSGPAQFAVSDFTLNGACGSSEVAGAPWFPGFVSMSIGTWTDPLVYPGVEGLRWNAGAYGGDDCFGVFREDAFYGITTRGGFDAFTIPSDPTVMPQPLAPTFVDQHNALRSGVAALNVPWKRSDRFLHLNLP